MKMVWPWRKLKPNRQVEKQAPSEVPGAGSAPSKKPQLTGWRKWAFRLAAMTLIPALFFGLLELGLRVFGYGYPTSFFLSSEIDGRQVFIDNPQFARRFFPEGVARTPIPFALPAAKSANTYRIFVFGESAAMGFPEASFSFARILEVMLRDRYPDTHFEIINTAIPLTNSHAILPIARECGGHGPDLFIVYMGNNEVIGPFGAANVLGSYSPSLGVIRAHLGFKTTRIGQLLNNLGRLFSQQEDTARVWDGMATYLQSQIRADDSRLETLYANFRQNLRDICAAGRAAGATTLLCTVGCNLRDSPPFASLHPEDMTKQARQRWQEYFEHGAQAESAGKHADAFQWFNKAAAIDDRYADLQFALARCREALGQFEEARRGFLLARDLDTLRFRPDTRLNDTIRQVAASGDGNGVALVDAERAFAIASAHGIPGENLFYEHVHMKLSGNYVLARAVFDKVLEALPDSIRTRSSGAGPPLSEVECADRLAFTDWNRLSILLQFYSLQTQPPFTGQRDHAARDARMKQVILDLQPHGQPDALKRYASVYRRAIERSPADWMLHSNFAKLLVMAGDNEKAAEEARLVVKLIPHSYMAHQALADILHRQEMYQEAQEHCSLALRLSPDFDRETIHHLMGNILAKQGETDKAITHFSAALRLNPKNMWAHINLAEVLEAREDADGAIKHYFDAVRLAPDQPQPNVFLLKALLAMDRIDEGIEFYAELIKTAKTSAEAHGNLATLLARAGKLDEAAFHYGAGLKINPNSGDLHFEFAGLLAKQGKTALAIREYDEALRLRPGWPEAIEKRNRLKSAKEGPR
jgi:tetratricopeptide (TPR) repeat protein